MFNTDSTRRALASFGFAMGLLAAVCPVATHAGEVDLASPPPAVVPPESARLVEWVVASGDNNGVPFAVIDKVAAVVAIYDAQGRLLGAEPALLGSALGDESTPGIGDRELSDIKPEERTTPAGRFVASYGPSQGHGRVLWVDLYSAISMHAVVTTKKEERRLERLATETPDDNRISYGCINVSKAFYEDVVQQTFKDTRGIVYILPETKTVAEVFPSYGVHLMQASAGGAAGGQ
jgi:hypothetical protein